MKRLGFFGFLAIAFIVLRLCNVITWPWWLVLSPIIVPVFFVVVFFLLLLWRASLDDD